MDISTLLPNLKRWKNEIVMWVGIIAGGLLWFQAELEALDTTSVDAWMAFIPVVTAYVTRMFNTGPETAAAQTAAAAGQ